MTRILFWAHFSIQLYDERPLDTYIIYMLLCAFKRSSSVPYQGTTGIYLLVFLYEYMYVHLHFLLYTGSYDGFNYSRSGLKLVVRRAERCVCCSFSCAWFVASHAMQCGCWHSLLILFSQPSLFYGQLFQYPKNKKCDTTGARISYADHFPVST